MEQENQEKMSVPGLVAAGHYAEIAENVDLEYKIIGEQVKKPDLKIDKSSSS